MATRARQVCAHAGNVNIVMADAASRRYLPERLALREKAASFSFVVRSLVLLHQVTLLGYIFFALMWKVR